MKDEPVKFAAAFVCPNCGQKGARHWKEGPDHGHAQGSNRLFVDVSRGFHCEDGRAANGEPVIVCDVCDEIQPD
ncbi:MAG: hypothetical protein ABI191_06350 [Rhizomicrobium sp.]